jgi:tRNA-binding EMAP/Myf-like protein
VILLVVVLGFLATALLGIFKGLISDEIRGWLDLLPFIILRLARARLNEDQRQSICDIEWGPELEYIMKQTQTRPITRFVWGTKFATGLFISARRIARQLNRGLENSAAETLNIGDSVPSPLAGGQWKPGVVVGRVVTVRPHPNGERIWLADVDVGTGRHLQIVWGSDTAVPEGSLVPVALPGARVQGPPFNPKPYKIRRRHYRGEKSEGLMCSRYELGWDDDPSADASIALLDPTADLFPGRSLDSYDGSWRAIVLSPS